MAKQEYAIAVENYTKTFKEFTAVKDVSFKVKKGSIHGFIGPNGAGKTTTIKAIIGAYYVNDGNMTINGYKAGTMEAKRDIGYIPERASFPEDMNTLQYLRTMIELSGFKAAEAKERADRILAQLGLTKHGKRKPKDFSSGMKKKVLIAQALILDPSVLVLDEPAANLDPTARADLFNTLRELAATGKTIFISSHILTEMQGLIDEVTFIFQGKVRYSGVIEMSGLADLYDVKTENDELLIKILEDKGFEFKKMKSGLEIKIPKRNEFFQILIDNDIKLRTFSDNAQNISKIYDSFVSDIGTESGVEV